MPEQNSREVEHEITVAARATDVYRLIADVESWPRIFPPTIYIDRVERGPGDERIRIWATANGEVKTWSSHRTLDPDRLRIGFRQEVSTPPVAEMGGTWIIEPLGAVQSRVRLLHDYRAVDDAPDSLTWIDRAVDRNSRSELAALKINVELATAAEELMVSFEDTISINGAARDAYDFVNEAKLWTARLPHVAAVRLEEDTPGLQALEMETRATDGSTHSTRSIRVCFPHRKIVYKQTTLPALMSLHTGCWLFEETPGGATATSAHTVVIRADAITRILGKDAGVPQARAYVQAALSANSQATLGYARDYAEHGI
jgi:aromatase